jgi:hypothetical protein
MGFDEEILVMLLQKPICLSHDIFFGVAQASSAQAALQNEHCCRIR